MITDSDLFLSNDNLVTYGTVRAFGKTGSDTSGSYSLVNNNGVSCCNLVCNVAVATYSTSVGGVTCLGTSRSSYCCIIAVTKSFGFVCNVAVATYSTSVGGVTCLGTSRSSYCCIIAVTKSFGFVCNVALATVTGVGGVSSLSTGGSSYCCLIAVLVRRNVVRIFYTTLTLTFYEVMGVRRNVVRILCLTNGTSAVCVVVAESCNLIRSYNVATELTGLSSEACSCTSGCGYNRVVIVGALLLAKTGNVEGKLTSKILKLGASRQHGKREKEYEKN